MSAGNGTGKSRRSKLQEAHAVCEKAYSELAKAHASGDREEVALVWSDVIAADAAVAAVKASVVADILAVPVKGVDEKKAAAKTPEKKASEDKTSTKEVAKKPVAKVATPKKSTVSASAFSNWLRVVRTGLGMTQSALGEKIGASYTQMFRWEKGLSVPADEYVTKIERIAGKTCPYRQKAAV